MDSYDTTLTNTGNNRNNGIRYREVNIDRAVGLY